MLRPPPLCLVLGLGLLTVAAGVVRAGDDRVTIIAVAQTEYTRAKFADGRVKPETYVVMPGNFFGGATRDRTLEKMSFRTIANSIAFELSKREYWPAKSPNDADLLMVIHWGVTSPRASMQEMAGRTSLSTDVSASPDTTSADIVNIEENLSAGNVPAAMLWDLGERSNENSLYAEDVLQQQGDANSAEANQQDTAQILGLVPTLKKYNNALIPTVNETAVHYSLKEERYFIVVKVYDLRKWQKGKVNRSIWTIRLNIGAPGNNFQSALTRMAHAGVDWFGRTTTEVQNVRAKTHKGEVSMPDIVILGEHKK